MASSDQDKQLRAELAQGLGYFPASLAPEDVARYREQIAERKARDESGERDGWGPGGDKWRQWDHLKEERRRTEIETQGRASVADLYEWALMLAGEIVDADLLVEQCTYENSERILVQQGISCRITR